MIRNIKYLSTHDFFHSVFSKASTLAGAAVVSLCMVACASTPPPNSQIAAAETAIANAERAQVTDYASPELVEARKYLADAKVEINEKNMTRAARFAQRAQVNADLAMAKTAAVKAKEVNDELQKGTTAVKQELQRNEGAK